MSLQATPTPPDTPPAAEFARMSRVGWIVGVVLLIGVIGVGSVIVFNLAAKRQVQVGDLTMARSLEQGQVRGEGRVFDVGEPVLFVFTLENGQADHVVSIRVEQGGTALDAAGLSYAVQNDDAGMKTMSYTPGAAGSYTARLYLDGEAVAGQQVSFRVAPGGAKLQEVQTAKALDEAFHPTEATQRFSPKDMVYISYRAVGAAVGDMLQVRYSINGVVQPSDPKDQDRFTQAGTFRGYFSIQGPPSVGLRTGNYRAEIFYNQDLAAVVTFTVE